MPIRLSAARALRAAPAQSMRNPARLGKPTVRAMFSATVIHSTRPRSWWMKEIGQEAGFCRAWALAIFPPLKRISPRSWW